LRELRGELTILAISHQPAILKAADRAYRLQDGVVALVADRSDACLPPGEGQDDTPVAVRTAPRKAG